MYRLERFDTVTLPQADFVSDISAAPARSATVTAGGSSYDAYSTDVAPQKLPYPLTHRCAVMETTLAAMRTSIDALRALVGTRAVLYRRALDDDTVHWAWARLMSLPETRKTNELFAQPIELRFEVWSNWRGNHHGEGWTFDSGEYLDSGLVFDEDETTTLNSATSPDYQDITINNAGDLATTDVNIKVTAGSAAITKVEISKPYGNVSWYYDGTIATTKSLIVASGSKTVTNDGTGDSDHFHLAAAHSIEPWLRMAVGDNIYRVALTGGSTDSTITFDFSDGWA
jgi:hypothetical protein